MPSPFDEIDRAGQSALDELLGEGILIIGMLVGDYSVAADPDRPAQPTRAIVSNAPMTTDPRGQRVGAEIASATKMAVIDTELQIDQAAALALSWQPKRGDTVILTDRAGSPRLSINAVWPGQFGELQITATAGGTAPSPQEAGP